MTPTPERILTPGMNVDLVLNLNSLSPVTRPTTIHDGNPKKREILIAQPSPPLLPSHGEGTIHLTALVRDPGGRKRRYGIRCEILDFVSGFRLARDQGVEAVRLRYGEKLETVNIRSAYRISPNRQFSMAAKLILGTHAFSSGKDFTILDLSAGGIGIVVPRRIDGSRNPLLELKTGTSGKLGMLLKQNPTEEDATPLPDERFACAIRFVRINPTYTERTGLMGARFVRLPNETEEAIGRFVHKAQLAEIRQLNRY